MHAGRPWYRAYCAAMLETRVQHVLESVECARKEILERTEVVSADASASSSERKELHEALHYLTMLLDCFQKEGGRLLWC